MKKWKRIIVHCSDSTWANAAEIREWHVGGNGWSDIGYHYVIDNGKIRPNFFLNAFDGSIEIGRQIDGDQLVESKEVGAHAYGFNSDSIGICLVGKNSFTSRQIATLFNLLADLMKTFEISSDNVIGHYEIDPRKTCPNIDMESFRNVLKQVE